MFEVARSNRLPQRVNNITQWIENNPIETCSTVNDLVKMLKSVMVASNRTMLATVYMIGKAMDDALLSGKFPGMTIKKLGAAIGLSERRSYAYHKVAELLKPDEVDALGHVAYKVILEFPAIREKYGEGAFKEVKFRLMTDDFEGVKVGMDGLNRILVDVAQKRLDLEEGLPDIIDPNQPVIDAEVKEVEEVHNPCLDVEDDGTFEDSGETAVDKLLADRKKAAKEDVDDVSENGKKSTIALAQAKTNIVRLRSQLSKIAMDYVSQLERVFDNEDYIIGDPTTDEKYRELLGDLADMHISALEMMLKAHKEYQKHGECLRKIELPEGATAATLLDPKN